MNDTSTETLCVVVEREVPHPAEKIWRALTQSHLIEEWLMKNDFKPDEGHRFNLSADWGAVDCQVQAVEPNRTLSYTWDTKDLEECRHVDPHPYERRDPPAHGALGLPAGSAAVLPGRHLPVAAVPCGPGAGPGADRLKVCRLVFRGGPIELERMDSADPPVAGHRLYRRLHRQHRRPGRGGAGLLGVPPGADPALPAPAHRSLLVRAALCHQVARWATHGGEA